MKTVKTIILAILLLSLNNSLNAQTYKVVNDKLVRIDTLKAEKKTKDVKTKLTLKKKGKTYPVYKSKRGAYYIIRISKKTNKAYKQYLKIEE